MHSGHKYRLYPTTKQIKAIEVNLSAGRFVYNWFLDYKIKEWKSVKNLKKSQRKTKSLFDLMKLIPVIRKENMWIAEADQRALAYEIRNLMAAYKNFFRRCKLGEKPGFPKFKSKYREQSIIHSASIHADLKNQKIKLPKNIGWVKCKMDRLKPGKLKSITVRRTTTGKYFVSLLIDDDQKLPLKAPIPSKNEIVGVDMNIHVFLATSEGNVIENPRYYDANKKRLRRAQRKLSRRVKGSKNRKKQKLVVARQHEKIANKRNNFIHSASNLLSKKQCVAIEDLSIKKMMTKGSGKKKKNIAKGFSDTALGEFKRQLQYKTDWQGTNLLVTNPENTNKKCNSCGAINNAAAEVYTCSTCATELHRGYNSAINIRNLAYELVIGNMYLVLCLDFLEN